MCLSPLVVGSTPRSLRNFKSILVPMKSIWYPFGTYPAHGVIPSKIRTWWASRFMSYMELKFSRQLNDYTELHQSQPSALNGVPTEETSSSAQIALGGDAVKPWPGPSNTAATTFFIKCPGYA